MTTRRALAFSFLDRYASLLLSIVSTMIIARLLTPGELGIFSVTMVLIGFLSSLRDLGAGQYLVQERDLTAERQRATWTVLLGMGCFMALLVLLAAWPVARFYAEPAMVPIMLVIAVNFAVNPFGSLTYAWLMREMRFDVVALMRFGGSLAGAVVSVVLAWRDWGPISLAYGSLASTLVTALIGMAYRPAHFHWMPGLAQVRRVIGFGGKISASALLGNVGAGAPELALGKLQDLAAAGLYSRGNGLAAMFHRLVMDATNAVALPLFAKAQREQGSSVEPWLRAVSYVCALGWSFLGGVALLAWPLTRVLYGDQWDGSVRVTQIVCMALIIALPAALSPHLLIGNGHAGRVLRVIVAVTLVQVAAVATGAWFGLEHTAVGYLVAQVFMVVAWLRASNRAIQFEWQALLQVLWHSAKVAALTLLVPLAFVLAFSFRPTSPMAMLSGVLPLCALTFYAALRLTAHPLLAEVQALLARLPGRRRPAAP
jgi:O-antigen/teichoic acid export membrane protein